MRLTSVSFKNNNGKNVYEFIYDGISNGKRVIMNIEFTANKKINIVDFKNVSSPLANTSNN